MERCNICNGAGWILKELNGSSVAVRCKCYEVEEIERLKENAGIPARYKNCTLNNFKAIAKDQVVAKKIALNFVEDYPDVEAGLFFIGPCGVGKTHLATGILNAIIEKGMEAKFCDFSQLLMQIRSSYNVVSKTTESDILTSIFHTPLLLIDDFACQRVTDWVLDILSFVIKSLYNEKTILLLTTNVAQSNYDVDNFFDHLSDRIGYQVTSRLYEMCQIIRIEAADYRKEFASAYHKSKWKNKGKR